MALPRRCSWIRLAAAATLLLVPAPLVSAQYGLEVAHGFNSTSAGGNVGGAGPVASLVEASDGSLWGTTLNGGTADAGVVFQLLPDHANGLNNAAMATNVVVR